jgi:MYXO-CTERM domain-containing protein
MKLGIFLCATAMLVLADFPAQAASIDISGLVNSDLTTYTGGGNYPQNGGPLTVAGIPFQLATIGPDNHTAVIQSSTDFGVTQTYVIPVNLADVTIVYTLINSAFGAANTNIGALVFRGASGETYTYTLTEGFNVRDHFNGSFVNTATDLAGTASFGGGADRLDMQSIVLPTIFASDTLTEIDFESFGQGGFGAPFVAAITTSTSETPLPAALSLFVGGLGLVGALARRRRRRH